MLRENPTSYSLNCWRVGKVFPGVYLSLMWTISMCVRNMVYGFP